MARFLARFFRTKDPEDSEIVEETTEIFSPEEGVTILPPPTIEPVDPFENDAS